MQDLQEHKALEEKRGSERRKVAFDQCQLCHEPDARFGPFLCYQLSYSSSCFALVTISVVKHLLNTPLHCQKPLQVRK